MSSNIITFEYNTSSTLTKFSSVLLAYDLYPQDVVKKTSSLWNVSYNKDDLISKPVRMNELYKIFCSSSQNSIYNSTTFAQLKVDFCLQPESYPSYYCPNNIGDFNNLNTTSCSRLISTNPEFNNTDLGNRMQCSELKRYLDIDSTNDDVKTVMQTGYRNFCSKYPTMKECQCYNRSLFDAYNNAKAILSSGTSLPSGNESCWYIPCQYQTNIQVDPSLQEAYARVQCPNVCQNIIAAVNVKNVSLNNISMSNNCLATSGNAVKDDVSDKMTEKDVQVVLKTKEPSRTNAQETSNGKDQTTILWIVISVLGFCIVIILLLSLISSFSKKKTKDKQIQ